jgi:hypothetical protein
MIQQCPSQLPSCVEWHLISETTPPCCLLDNHGHWLPETSLVSEPRLVGLAWQAPPLGGTFHAIGQCPRLAMFTHRRICRATIPAVATLCLSVASSQTSPSSYDPSL